MVTTPPPSADEVAQVVRPHGSMRDPATLQAGLQAWLTDRLPNGADPIVDHLVPPTGNGMSSETVLFDATWTESGPTRAAASFVPPMSRASVVIVSVCPAQHQDEVAYRELAHGRHPHQPPRPAWVIARERG